MKIPSPKPMIVAGIMSGTSADGVDIAICRISPGRPQALSSRPKRSEVERPVASLLPPKLKVLGHRAFAYDKKLRTKILAAAGGEATNAAELTQLAWHLGGIYADCVETASRELKLKPQLIACHGQTIYHQATPANFLGKPLRCTSQIGEAAVLAERLKLPVISDFRPADLAAGGQGAPLVPMLDYCVFRNDKKNRLLLNLGGIANITALPAGCGVGDILAFDTGPANMVIDAAMHRLYGRGFDKSGATAARGRVLDTVVNHLLQTKYFSDPPPKSCGREEFGAIVVDDLLALCKNKSARKQDAIATATALTAESILDAYRRFCWPHLGRRAPLARATEMFVAGGGANNTTLMRMIADGFAALGVRVATTASAGLAVEAKEAAAFALLGWLTWHGLPGNVPSATGASRAVVIGKVTLA